MFVCTKEGEEQDDTYNAIFVFWMLDSWISAPSFSTISVFLCITYNFINSENDITIPQANARKKCLRYGVMKSWQLADIYCNFSYIIYLLMISRVLPFSKS
jgi:hypothetical protein